MSSSDTTRASAPAKQTAKPDEATFLRQQAADAQSAMGRTVEKMRQDAQRVVDPRAWMQERPWLTLGAAIVAGFTAAYLLPRSGREEDPETEHFETPSHESEDRAHSGNGHSRARADHGRSLLRKAVRMGFNLLRPALIAALTSGITTRQAAGDDRPAVDPDPDLPPDID